MTKKKSKKHNLDACLRCMHMLEDGNSFNHIHMTYGISEDRLKVLWYKYQVKGIDGLQKCKNVKSDYAFKKKIVLDIENNHLTLHSAWLKYGASPQRLSVWLKIARTEGLSGLNQFKRRGRPLCMGNQERTENL